MTDCSQAWCTSPNGQGGYDCWAGGHGEAYSCSVGSSDLTGERWYGWGTYYYEYTCCRSTGNADGAGRHTSKAGAPLPLIGGAVAGGAVLIAAVVAVGIILYRRRKVFSQK